MISKNKYPVTDGENHGWVFAFAACTGNAFFLCNGASSAVCPSAVPLSDSPESWYGHVADSVGADIYEIRPAVPYTKADLNWMDKKSRSTIEMNDKTIRPAITDQDAQIDRYETIFLGFPIWWYVAPTIINTFLESYDFSGKKIILFATSGGSKFGKTVEELKVSVPASCEIIEGKLLNGKQTIPTIRSWTESLTI